MADGERGPKGDPGDIIEHGKRGERGPKGDVGSPGANNGSYPEGTPAWLKILLMSMKQFGVFTIVAMVFLYWLATRIAEPLMATYNESIRVQNKVVQDQAASLEKISKTLELRIELNREAKKMMTDFAENSMRGQAQLLRDHQDFMAELRRSAALSASNKPGT